MTKFEVYFKGNKTPGSGEIMNLCESTRLAYIGHGNTVDGEKFLLLSGDYPLEDGTDLTKSFRRFSKKIEHVEEFKMPEHGPSSYYSPPFGDAPLSESTDPVLTDTESL